MLDFEVPVNFLWGENSVASSKYTQNKHIVGLAWLPVERDVVLTQGGWSKHLWEQSDVYAHNNMEYMCTVSRSPIFLIEI